MTVTLTIDDSDLRRHLRKLDVNLTKYGRMITRRKAEMLVEDLRKKMSVVTGNLHNRTRKVPTRKGWGYNIVMPYYGDYLDRGTKPSSGGKIMPISKAIPYTRAYGIRNVNAWRRHIAENGTRPHPFINAAIMSTDRRTEQEFRKLTKKMLKK